MHEILMIMVDVAEFFLFEHKGYVLMFLMVNWSPKIREIANVNLPP